MELISEFFSPEAWQVVLPVFGRLLLAAFLGMLIGLEREARGHAAGIRTHMLIVFGVTLISEVSRAFGGIDESRIAAQIVTGIGFLGAGAILRTGFEIRGLTTAASMWAASGVGMAISVGGPFLIVAVLSTLLILTTLAVVSKLERRLYPRTHPRELSVQLMDRAHAAGLIRALNVAEINVKSVRVLSEDPLQMSLILAGPHDRAMQVASSVEGIEDTHWAEG
ncbi:MAG TPA: MgtC/SapB family protein [Fimbriimonas sp.]